MGTDDRPKEPRVPPLAPEDRSPEADKLLARLPPGPDGGALNVFATMAHHPALLKGWLAFGTALFINGLLPPRDRELLALRTIANCRCSYEWGPHVQIARTVGITDEEIDRLWRGPDEAGWDPHDAALLRCADELHHGSCVSDDTWTTLASRYDHALMLEVLFTVGQYHLGSFMLNSAGVEPEAGMERLPGTGEG